MTNITPNLKPLPKYQTWIPGRTEEYKLHTTKGHVKNAIFGCCYTYPAKLWSDVYVYEWRDNWVLIANYDEGTLREDLDFEWD